MAYHSQEISMPDYDSAWAVSQAEAAGGDTDADMSDAPDDSSSSDCPSSLGSLSPPMPFYNSAPPHSFDIPAAQLIDLTPELLRPGGPLPIAGPYLDIDIGETMDFMLESLQNQGQHFYRLKWALNYLSQGFNPTCKFPGCTSRCRIVDHELNIIKGSDLRPGGARHLDYVVSDREHAVFLCTSCHHDGWTPSFCWYKRSVGFHANPVVSVQEFDRWSTPAFFFNSQRDTDAFPNMVSGPFLSRRERRAAARRDSL